MNIYTVFNAIGSHNWKKIHVIMQSPVWVGQHKIDKETRSVLATF